jgi:hypothetical protein
VTNAGKNLGPVALDRHAAAAPVPALAAAKLRVECVDVELKASGHSVNGHHERLAVRLAGGEKPEHEETF